MRGKVTIWSVSIIMIIFVSNLYAATMSELWTFWNTHQTRQRQAKEWRDGFIKLNAKIPTLSPAEERWLQTEYDDELRSVGGHFTKRAIDAASSREFDLRVAKRQTIEIISVLSDLSRTTNSDQRTEVSLWTQLASLFMDSDYWQAIEGLIERGVLDDKLTINNIESKYRSTYTLWAKFIVDNIVINHLNGHLNK